MNPKPNNHYSLTKKQQAILNLLYRFRFATSQQLSQTLDIGKATINKRLQLMTELQYIGRRYEPEYHLLRKHATYYLLPKGVDALKKMPGNKFDAYVLRNTRKDQGASEQFVEQSLGLFDIYCRLNAELGDSLHFFTRSQLANKYDYFSEFTPAAYMRIDKGDEARDFFLEYLQSSKPFFTAIQRLKEYVEYGDSGEWEAAIDGRLPPVLLVCDSQRLQSRLMKRAGFALSEADDDLKFYVTITTELNAWLNLVDQDEEVHPLASI
jgi:DNA-binding MarR family transcriptional regulator